MRLSCAAGDASGMATYPLTPPKPYAPGTRQNDTLKTRKHEMPLTPEQRSEQARKAAASRKTNGNRYTTGARSEMPIKEKDALRAEFAAKKLEAFMRDPQKHPMEPTEVTAAKILLDKGKPSLQAVEQTNIEPALARTESEIIESLNKIIDANPDILTQLIAIRARSEASKPVDATQHAEVADKAA